ncbi:MAG: endonuclease/exonuclease/phosphatase family protein [Gammaproteobacteria bacterium]|nr:endonuclease/exonuclease/phosphatase family protein [Gammaproteobacteria bacterium]MBQ0840383.1 endonuclease/exonuclease/phosphatase family protein [Gammaproteobacteria bacterium]
MKLRIITYNIHRAIGLDRRYQPDRIIKILADHDADIVLLQEVDEGAPRSKEHDMAQEIAGELGYDYYAAGHNVSLRKGRYGNATLSRFPITRERNIDLTIGDRKRRGCQHTAIAIPTASGGSTQLDVFNLHLGLSPLERQRQAGMLMRCKEFTDIEKNAACIVGGDFNDWLSRLRALFVEGMALRCATDKETRIRTRPIKTYPSFAPRGGLDRIYYRGNLRAISAIPCRHQVARVASDHLPIIAEFELTDG